MKANLRPRRPVQSLAEDQTVSVSALLGANGTDAQFRLFIQDLLSVSVQLQAVRAGLGKLMGLTGVQYSLLVAVLHMTQQDDTLTVSTLARHLHLSGTFVTAEVGKLSAIGLISKEPNPSDGRSVLLRLTPAAEVKLHDLMPTIRRVNDEIFRHLDRKKFEALAPRISEMASTLEDATTILDQIQRERRRKPGLR